MRQVRADLASKPGVVIGSKYTINKRLIKNILGKAVGADKPRVPSIYNYATGNQILRARRTRVSHSKELLVLNNYSWLYHAQRYGVSVPNHSLPPASGLIRAAFAMNPRQAIHLSLSSSLLETTKKIPVYCKSREAVDGVIMDFLLFTTSTILVSEIDTTINRQFFLPVTQPPCFSMVTAIIFSPDNCLYRRVADSICTQYCESLFCQSCLLLALAFSRLTVFWLLPTGNMPAISNMDTVQSMCRAMGKIKNEQISTLIFMIKIAYFTFYYLNVSEGGRRAVSLLSRFQPEEHSCASH